MKKYNKLVRDNIITLIRKNGQTPEYYIAGPREYEERLFEKMKEELQEFIDNPCMEEAADMYEVWLAILDRWDMVPIDVISCANKKRKEKGRFADGCVLTGVESGKEKS